MQLDHDQLHKLLDVLADSDIQEFRLEGDDFRLEVRRNLPVTAVAAPVVPVVAQAETPAPVVDVSTQGDTAPAAPPAAAPQLDTNGVTLARLYLGFSKIRQS